MRREFGAGHVLSSGTFRGVRRQTNRMIGISYSNEISANGGFVDPDGTVVYRGYHINSFWADVPGDIGTAGSGRTVREVIRMVEDAGGLTHLNHPGHYTGAWNNPDGGPCSCGQTCIFAYGISVLNRHGDHQ